MKTYDELNRIVSFEERFRYLSLSGLVGDRTFGSERYLNQRFYNSMQWRRTRDFVILRDSGCDLGVPGREIHNSIYIHHINPLTPNDIKIGSSMLLDPNNLITVSHRTHNAIHYGDEKQLQTGFIERRPGDTKLW